MSPLSSQQPDGEVATSIPSVAVTAYGATSCLGNGLEVLRDALKEGRSGLEETPTLPAEVGEISFPACIGTIPGELPVPPAREGFQSTRQLQIAWQTALQIDQRVKEAVVRWGADRVGLILGTSTGAILATELALISFKETGALPREYSCQDGHAMDAAARYLAQSWQLKGPAFAVSAACASGAKALASAKRLIESGVCDAVIAGGVDSLCRMTIHGFHSLGVLSDKNCVPFDDSRYGMNVAEGGALLLLEKDHPDANSLGYLLGAGESSDAYHMSAPDPEGRGQGLAMTRALQAAGVDGSQIDYLNAHGTGTQANDDAEALAVRTVLPGCPTSSTKGLVGHQLGAAGATEAIIAIEVLRGLSLSAAGSLNREKFPLESRKRQLVQSNSFAFGGVNISLVLGSSPGTPMHASRPSFTESIWEIESAVSSSDLGDMPDAAWGSTLLPARARARAGTLTRLCAELAARSGLSKEELQVTPVVFSSALGQLQITRKLIGLFLEGDSSPLAFQNSVHNSVFGTLSLALSNREPSSSLAGGRSSTFCALLEATTFLWTQPEVTRVLVICADEQPPTELGLPHKSTLGAAFVISRASSSSRASLAFRRGLPPTQATLLEQVEDANDQSHGHLSPQGVALSVHLNNSIASPIAFKAADIDAHFFVTPRHASPKPDEAAQMSEKLPLGGTNERG